MKKYKSFYIKKTILMLSVFGLLFTGCESESSGQYTYRPPENINDRVDVGTLDEVNIDAKLIVKAVDKIHQGKYKEVHSMLIFKDDKLVFEEYFKGHEFKWDAPYHHGESVSWNRKMSHNIMSDTKSITSVCIGIAIDRGFIKSVHQSIFDYLPDHQHLNTDGKNKITIEHLLTMTSGLEWNEWGTSYTSLKNDTFKLWIQCEDQITCILEKPLINEPGTSFTYSGGGMIVLCEIIKNAAKMNIEEFSGKYLFAPLEIDSFNWSLKFKSGVMDASGGLKITPRDMVKIGVTFLNNGVWKEKQIIPKKWVEKSAAPFPGNTWINIPGEDSGFVGYSYSWWTKNYFNSGKRINMFYAGGWGGQYIMVLPEVSTVVVFTSGNYVTKRPPFKILKKYVIPAID
ncbi:MAG: serine hydrolase domain-containing protein [Promethearchaeota archaeon]